jgi:uncharacterized protein
MRLRLPPEALEWTRSKREGGLGGVGAFTLRYRLPIGLILVATSLFMLYGVTKVQIATSFVDFFPRQHENVHLYEKYREQFGGAQTLTVAISVKKGDIFNLATLKKIHDINYAVDALPGVNHPSVRSLASYRITYAEAIPGALIAKPYMYPDVPKNGAEIAELKRLVEKYKPELRTLVSEDNRTALVVAAFNERVLNYHDLFNEVQKIVAANQDADHVIYLGGEPIIRGYGYHYLPNISLCFAAAVLTMAVLLYISLGHRSRWWAPMVTGTLSAVWGLGFVGWIGYNFDPVMLVIPFVLTARDLSHGIQWQGRYYNELDGYNHKYAAVVATTNYMLPPGFLSIIADIAGIIFISLGGIPVLHNIAMAGSVWLASSLTMVFVFEPVFLSYSPTPLIRGNSFGERLWGQWTPGGLKGVLERFVRIPVTPGRVRGTLLVSAGLLIVWGLAAGQRSKIGYTTLGTPLYRSNSKVNKDLVSIAKDFPLDESWVVLVTPAWPDPQSVLAPAVLRMMDDLRARLLEDPSVRDVINFSSTVEKPFNQQFHNAYPKYMEVPGSSQLSGNLWYLYLSGTAPGEMERYVGQANDDAVVRVFLADHTFDTLNRVRQVLAEFQRTRVAPDPDLSHVQFLTLGGLGGLYAAANDVLFRLDIVNISFVLLVVFIFSVFAFRSFVAGLLFVLSCVLANFAAFIYMGIRGVGLTIDTVPVISLGIGLGVDYGIYVVARIRDEVARGETLENAVIIGINRTGAAVFSTFSVMVGGIVPWIFSPLLFHNQMSVLLTFLMFTNMVAGILVLPAYIAWSRSNFICRYETEAAPERAARPAEA